MNVTGASAEPRAKRQPEDAEFDAMGYLTVHGKDKLDQLLEDVAKSIDTPAFTEIGGDEKSLKAFHNELRASVALAMKLHKDCINFQWKIKKRVNVPAASLELVGVFRNQVTALWTFLQQFQAKDAELMLDVDKCRRMSVSIGALGIKIPVRCQVIQYKAQAPRAARAGARAFQEVPCKSSKLRCVSKGRAMIFAMAPDVFCPSAL